MVFNVTFNNTSVISWRSVLLVEETWVPLENHRHMIWTQNVSDCIACDKSNYHTITTTMGPRLLEIMINWKTINTTLLEQVQNPIENHWNRTIDNP